MINLTSQTHLYFYLGISKHKHRISAKSLSDVVIPVTVVVDNRTRNIVKSNAKVIYTLFLQWEINTTGEKIHQVLLYFNKHLMESPETSSK